MSVTNIASTIERFEDLIINNEEFYEKNFSTHMDITSGKTRVLTYWEEAKFTLSLLEPYLSKLKPQDRILEIGAGASLLTNILINSGFKVDAIEPSSLGFGFMDKLMSSIQLTLADAGCPTCKIFDCALEHFKTDKSYDLIFSSHVLEHVSDIDASFLALSRLTGKKTINVHLCPNYFIPYEPHVAKIIIPFIGKWNRNIFRNSYYKNQEMWNSVNFITSRKVKRSAAKYGLKVTFKRKVFSQYIERFGENTELAKRHRSWLISTIVLIIKLFGIDRKLPSKWLSPMLFEMTLSK